MDGGGRGGGERWLILCIIHTVMYINKVKSKCLAGDIARRKEYESTWPPRHPTAASQRRK